MADQPYQFGDVVDGHRWTITGWEPVEPVERTVGVPRLLEARYAATQEAQARQQTQTLEPEAPVVVDDSPTEPDVVVEHRTSPATDVHAPDADVVAEAARPDRAQEPEPSYSLEALLGGGRRVVAAPDLAIEYDEEQVHDTELPAIEDALTEQWPTPTTPLDEPEVEETTDQVLLDEGVEALQAEEPVDEASTEQWPALDAAEAVPVGVLDEVEEIQHDLAPVDELEHGDTEAATPEPEPYDARPAAMRAWYGLGLEPIEEPEPAPSAETTDDDPFAAALVLGARALAESYQPSEIEIAAGAATAAAREPAQPWSALAVEPIDEWTAVGADAVAPEPLDAYDLAYGSASLPEPSTSEPSTPEPEPRVVAYTPPPPAGWYPGSA